MKINGIEVAEGEKVYLDPDTFPVINIISKEEAEKKQNDDREHGIYNVSTRSYKNVLPNPSGYIKTRTLAKSDNRRGKSIKRSRQRQKSCKAF